MVQYAPEDCLTHSVPNEGKRSAILGAAMVAMGLRKGTADYVIVYRGKVIYLEFKCPKDIHGPKTYQKKEQREFETAAKAAGAFYYVIRSQAEFIGTMHGFGLLERLRAQ